MAEGQKTVDDNSVPDDGGVEAITKLLDILRPLRPPVRDNVLDFVFRTLGISAPASAAPAPHQPVVLPAPGQTVLHSLHPPAPPGGQMDLRTLKEQKNPTAINQMVAVMAYYLEHLAPAGERRDYVVPDDIKKYFNQANYPLPTGRHDVALQNAKSAGYLDALSNGQYRLNPVGHNLVVHRLPAQDGAPTPRKRTAKTGSAKKAKKKTARKAKS